MINVYLGVKKAKSFVDEVPVPGDTNGGQKPSNPLVSGGGGGALLSERDFSIPHLNLIL